MFETAMFLDLMEKVVRKCHRTSTQKGFWGDTPDAGYNFAEKIALIHSELSEWLEAHRSGYAHLPTDKPVKVIDGGEVRVVTNEEEEAADIFIRLADLCGKRGIDLGRVVLAKMEYNETRPHKHGKGY